MTTKRAARQDRAAARAGTTRATPRTVMLRLTDDPRHPGRIVIEGVVLADDQAMRELLGRTGDDQPLSRLVRGAQAAGASLTFLPAAPTFGLIRLLPTAGVGPLEYGFLAQEDRRTADALLRLATRRADALPADADALDDLEPLVKAAGAAGVLVVVRCDLPAID